MQYDFLCSSNDLNFRQIIGKFSGRSIGGGNASRQVRHGERGLPEDFESWWAKTFQSRRALEQVKTRGWRPASGPSWAKISTKKRLDSGRQNISNRKHVKTSQTWGARPAWRFWILVGKNIHYPLISLADYWKILKQTREPWPAWKFWTRVGKKFNQELLGSWSAM